MGTCVYFNMQVNWVKNGSVLFFCLFVFPGFVTTEKKRGGGSFVCVNKTLW